MDDRRNEDQEQITDDMVGKASDENEEFDDVDDADEGDDESDVEGDEDVDQE